MRTLHLLPATLLITFTPAFQLPSLQPFLAALPISIDDYLLRNNENNTSSPQQHERDTTDAQPLLNRRSDGCPHDFNSCSNLGAPNLCCAGNAVCSADNAGNVACCPTGVACSGVIGGTITAGTINESGQLVSATAVGTTSGGSVTETATMATTTPATTTGGIILPTGTQSGGGGVVIAGGSTVASPAAAVRGMDVPLVVRAILRVLEYVPL